MLLPTHLHAAAYSLACCCSEASFGGDEKSGTHFNPRTLEQIGQGVMLAFDEYCCMGTAALDGLLMRLKSDNTGIGKNSNTLTPKQKAAYKATVVACPAAHSNKPESAKRAKARKKRKKVSPRKSKLHQENLPNCSMVAPCVQLAPPAVQLVATIGPVHVAGAVTALSRRGQRGVAPLGKTLIPLGNLPQDLRLNIRMSSRGHTVSSAISKR